MNKLDIVVSFDTTGSMYPCIHEVRQKVQEFVSGIFSKTEDTRVSILAHGDYCDKQPHGNYDITNTEFYGVHGKDHLINFAKTVKSTSGGDFKEMYESVFSHVRMFDWREDATRILIFMADAAPHERGDQTNLDWKEEADELQKSGVLVYPVRCLNHPMSNSFYNYLWNKFNVPQLRLQQFADIVPALTALIYYNQDVSIAEEYVETIKLNRGLAQFMETLLGKDVAPKDFGRSSLDAVSPFRFQILTVDADQDIYTFVLKSGAVFATGKGFYELTRPVLVQERKEVILVDKRTGDMFSGALAREMLGLPFGIRGRIAPINKPPGYDVFIQSTSYNRKLLKGTRFLYEAE